MTTAQYLSIACSALIMSAWATQGIADDQTTDTESRGAQSAPTATTTPGTVNPVPSTYRAEGTAADRTAPGATRTRVTEPGTANPLPATSPAEGTAADRSPPGETPVRGTAAAHAPKQATSRIARSDAPAVATTEAAHAMRTTNLIGLAVQDRQGMSVGSVEDVVIDAAEGRITYALVGLADSRGDAPAFVAVPWNTFARMKIGRAHV